jgi:hypothetical protein
MYDIEAIMEHDSKCSRWTQIRALIAAVRRNPQDFERLLPDALRRIDCEGCAADVEWYRVIHSPEHSSVR